jgi:hypothetical protein
MADKAPAPRELRNTEGWIRQINVWRARPDVFIEDYFNVKLKDVQKVQARVFGSCQMLYFVQSRGFGKTWITALCCLAMGVLYPGSLIAVISGTAEQATLAVRKIADYFIKNEAIAREIHGEVSVARHKAVCRLKNGSKIESFSMGTFRGNRAKVLVIDEAPEVKREDLTAIARPVLNTTREVCIQLGIKDYPSKTVSITSACLKSNYFYEAFTDTLKRMGKGDRSCFACALNYTSAVRVGISPLEFFIREREDMPDSKFMMEYGSVFVGAEAHSVFPYELTERCRVLEDVETAMPHKSAAGYVISFDLATSDARSAVNAVVCVLKLIEQESGYSLMKLVYMRSFHGKRLDALANEARKLLIKFPNTSKVVFDHRGLGDAFPQFLSRPWTDPETMKEHPPLVMDTERSSIHGAMPLLHPVMANVAVNQAMVSALIVAFEQERLWLPVSARFILDNRVVWPGGANDERRKLTTAEKAVFIEADALQVELGNIVGKISASGAVTYDTARTSQLKDRYSSLAMGVWYAGEAEAERQRRLHNQAKQQCIGLVTPLTGSMKEAGFL